MARAKKIHSGISPESIALEGDRARSYLHLALSFSPPNPQLFALGPGDETEPPGYRQWQRALQESNPVELGTEYTRLFTARGKRSAPPFASWYRPGAAAAVARIYSQHGLTISGQCPHPADHISLELEFVHYLITLRLDALAAGDRLVAEAVLPAEEHFIGQHLRHWLDPFCQRIRAHSANPFYHASANRLELLAKIPPAPNSGS